MVIDDCSDVWERSEEKFVLLGGFFFFFSFEVKKYAVNKPKVQILKKENKNRFKHLLTSNLFLFTFIFTIIYSVDTVVCIDMQADR